MGQSQRQIANEKQNTRQKYVAPLRESSVRYFTLGVIEVLLMSNPTLAEQKLAEEVAKLRLENRRLHQSPWTSPTVLIAAAGLVLSVVGNVIQFRASTATADSSARAMDLAESKWKDERLKLRAEVDALQAKNKTAAVAQSSLGKQLEKINAAIDALDNDIERVNVNLANSRNERDRGKLWKDKEKVQDEEMAIERNLTEFKTLSGQKEAAIARRTALERTGGIQR
jgi:hypothetical protein